MTADARRVILATLAAAAVAAALLVTIVLPAEYGIDPLRTGSALGLTALADASNRAVASQPDGLKRDAIEFVLGPYEFVEYKYHLEQGATMLYAWKGTAAVLHDFHGEKDTARGEAVSFEKKERRQGSGVFTAPFTGIHGWYWENPGGETITVSLSSAGFYSSALELRSDRTRHPHELTAPGGMAPPGIK